MFEGRGVESCCVLTERERVCVCVFVGVKHRDDVDHPIESPRAYGRGSKVVGEVRFEALEQNKTQRLACMARRKMARALLIGAPT